MAPSASRPETAGVRKDTSVAEGGEASFANVLDAEVDGADEVGAATDDVVLTQAATPQAPQAQPAPPATNAVELLISLQAATTSDNSATQPEATGNATAAPAVAAAPVVVPEISADAPAPATASARPTPPPEATQQVAQPALPTTPAEAAIAPAANIAGAASVAAPAVKASQPAATEEKKDEATADGEAAPTPAPSNSVKGVATTASTQPVVATAPTEPPPAAPKPTDVASVETATIAATATAPKQAPSNVPQHAEEPTSTQAVAAPDSATAGAPTQSSKDAQATNSASSQPTTGGAKPQANVQAAAAADATPEAKASAPIPAPTGSATSFAELLAAGRGAPDVGKAAPAHAAMQSAPPAVVQVYTRFVERFDGRAQRFEMRLDPAELGQVDIRIEIGADKKVHAVLAAHDSAALTDLMRGQRALERALMDAGIDLKDGGVKFELANDSNRGLAGQEQRRDAWSGEDGRVWRGFSSEVAVEASAADVAAATNVYSRRGARLDLVA